ncbi:hypothetical protein TSAR_000221 [Trichomalopsis sarcophagae]|uniref:TRASH domain-containing protein n=1 Tax=Trichomalopsis sarcophagae TaxID=543379 RepID=A0A232EIN1_9HYME|nr:hypothetical protein TSAR_000221 [Trichomalopsis sarcophagae]
MEPSSVETTDAVEKSGLSKDSEEVIQKNKEANQELNESGKLTNNTTSHTDKETLDSEAAMDVADSQEINRTNDKPENTNEETPMEVDESSEELSEKQSSKEDSSENLKETSKNDETSGKEKTDEAQKTVADLNKNEEVPNKSREASVERTKDNDISEEESCNRKDSSVDNENKSDKDMDTKKRTDDSAENIQEKKCDKKSSQTNSSEQNLECIDMENEGEKQLSSEKNDEVENTEFVQINQDKDDSQLENQPDAEDPFAADNLNTQNDNVEPMEVDSGKDKSSKSSSPKHDDNTQEKEKDTQSSDKTEEVVKKPDESEKSPKSSRDEASKSSKESSDKKDGSTEVLPGQDDELCIIPDSTKENKASDKDEVDESKSADMKKENTEKEEATDGKANQDDKNSKESKNDKDVTGSVDPSENSKENLKVAALTTGSNDIQVNKSPDGPSILTSDIIDIDDDNKNPEIEEIASREVCKQCKKEKACPIKVKMGTKSFNVCSEACKTSFTADNNKATDIPSEGVNSKRDKRCANCLLIVEAKDERNLSWETMEFCNEECLGKFQTKYGSYCRNCNGAVQPVSLGKYCVRFGYDVRQFCCSTCLEEFKKGLKVCSYCQKDISAGTEGFLAPVGDKGQFKDFCTQDCMEKYSKMNSTEPPTPEKKVCGVCQEEKVMHCEVQIDRNPSVPICSEPCFAAFKFVNKVDPDQCSTCKKYFQLPTKKGFVVFYEDEAHTFCNKTCLNVFIITNRKIVPCNWCKVKKYNFDMIKKELKTGQVMMMCSLNCLTLYQSQYTKSPITIPSGDTSSGGTGAGDPVPTGIPKRAIAVNPTQLPRPIQPAPVSEHPQIAPKKTLPVISSVTSLAAMANGQSQNTVQLSNATLQGNHPFIIIRAVLINCCLQVIYKQQVVTRPTSPVEVGNKMTQCKPQMHTKGVSVRPIPCDQSTQTEGVDRFPVPIPVPIYVPFPCHMYSMPFPVPVPIPIPIPVPIFIPTTRNSAKGIFKEIKRIQEKMPSDPFEAELLMMAEMVATEKKNESDSDSNDEARDDGEVNDGTPADSYSPEGVDSSNTFGDDMLQMALKMATGELDESATAVDLETELTPNTIQTPQRPQNENSENDVPERIHAPRGRKRGSFRGRGAPSKRARRSTSTSNDSRMLPPPVSQVSSSLQLEPAEKPDANMALKYTFGVNAWMQWVITKNAELEKQSTPTRKLKPFKTELLQLTADELNYSLCLFVKEVRKPNGAEYAPDTIYYLCLGIQQYLFENNRIDNIFTDAYYEKFTDCLNEVAKKFTTLYNEAMFVVTRVEEEHLWECKQLGAHSPHVLLNTLMYFNTKHFNLVSVEEHMQLSFSHIMKHWKRNPAAQAAVAAGKLTPGSRNVLLRFYPPQSALEANSKKKKVYEQQENEDNPLRCPVKFPESVKTRNDVFYLLPERSCVPDSPVWYSTSPLAKEHLVKMLYRIKMVKEINVALLSS